MFEIDAPGDKIEILSGLEALAAEITGFVESIPVDELLAPQGEHWSPERHLRHLAKSVRAVADGMKLPRALLALRFGRPRRPSRSYAEVVEIYRAALDAGGRAGGRYVPSEPPPAASADEWRDQVLDRWRRAGAALAGALDRWSDAALDRHQAPHPLLGMMTVRELLFFTLYHNAHHAKRIHERRCA